MTAESRQSQPRGIERRGLTPQVEIRNRAAWTRYPMAGHEQQQRNQRQPRNGVWIEQLHGPIYACTSSRPAWRQVAIKDGNGADETTRACARPRLRQNCSRSADAQESCSRYAAMALESTTSGSPPESSRSTSSASSASIGSSSSSATTWTIAGVRPRYIRYCRPSNAPAASKKSEITTASPGPCAAAP